MAYVVGPHSSGATRKFSLHSVAVGSQKRASKTLGQRIREAREAAGIASATDLAAKMRVSREAVSQWEKGETTPRMKRLADLAKALETTVEWLLGSEPFPGLSPDLSTHKSRGRETITATQPEYVPEVDFRAGAGGGGFTTTRDSDGELRILDEVVKDRWLIPPSYMRDLGVSQSRAFVVEIKGDSMSPTLESGDRVMVDMSDRIPSPPGVFVLWDGYSMVAKRLDHVHGTDEPRLSIMSDNPKHKAYEQPLDEVNVVGRVVWRAQRM